MRRKVGTAPDAAKAFLEAKAWLTQKGSGSNGLARWNALRTTGLRLRIHPYLGAASLMMSGHRQLVVSGHRVIYRIDPDTGESATAGDILIVAVFGPGQP